MAVVLFDSNILIDFLNGIPEARDELLHWDGPAISAVTWMEVRAGVQPGEEARLDSFLDDAGFEIIHIDDAIMRAASRIRGESIRKGPKLALLDAIIKATAEVRGLMIITRNTKDFKKAANVRIPYELHTATVVTVINATPRPEKSIAPTKTFIDMVVESKDIKFSFPDLPEPIWKVRPRRIEPDE